MLVTLSINVNLDILSTNSSSVYASEPQGGVRAPSLDTPLLSELNLMDMRAMMVD